MDTVTFNGEKLEAPYPCDPKDNSVKCVMSYNITSWEGGTTIAESRTYETECKCSLDGDTGFCGTIFGTNEYEELVSKIKQLFSQSQCHTDDRGDYRAMKEECRVATKQEWENAASANFTIENWPYVNTPNEELQACFNRLNKDSPQNLNKDSAYSLSLFASGLLSVSLLLLA